MRYKILAQQIYNESQQEALYYFDRLVISVPSCQIWHYIGNPQYELLSSELNKKQAEGPRARPQKWETSNKSTAHLHQPWNVDQRLLDVRRFEEFSRFGRSPIGSTGTPTCSFQAVNLPYSNAATPSRCLIARWTHLGWRSARLTKTGFTYCAVRYRTGTGRK